VPAIALLAGRDYSGRRIGAQKGMKMDTTSIEEFRRVLSEQRRTLFEEVAHVEADLGGLTETREAELEESAQEERTARLLARLDDRGKAELEQIDRALQRIANDDYGTCEACGTEIPRARLRTLPATPFCRDCVARAERGEVLEAESETRRRPAVVPPDCSIFSDKDIEEAINDHLRDDTRVDMDELRIVCRHGVVFVDGFVPSEREHQILLHTITDVLGLNDIEDRLQVKEILWARDDRDKADNTPETRPWEESAGTEDIVEVEEEGADFVPSIRPLPDEE